MHESLQRINYAEETGRLEIHNAFTGFAERAMLVDPGFLTSLFQAVLEIPGLPKHGADMFYDFGISWARQMAAGIEAKIALSPTAPAHRLKDFIKDEFVEHLNHFFSYSGLGQFRITEANRYYVVDLRNSPFDQMDAAMRPATNALMSGFFAGLFSSVSGRELTVVPIFHESDVRYLLTTDEFASQLRQHMTDQDSFADIAAAYDNPHLIAT